jgi:hypothetical protein
VRRDLGHGAPLGHAQLPYNPRPTDRERFPGDEYLAQVAALDREVQRVIDAII